MCINFNLLSLVLTVNCELNVTYMYVYLLWCFLHVVILTCIFLELNVTCE